MQFDPIPPVVVDRTPPETITPAEVRSWMSDQTVFVSSVMAGMTVEREAVRDTVETLGGRAVLFELLGGRDDDAQTAYLSGVRSSDIYVGILGERYGNPGQTGYSPTHTEYNEAVNAGLRICVWANTEEMDGHQQDFLEEIRTFHTTGSFSDPQELSQGLTIRLAEIASAANSPWCKLGAALFRASCFTDYGNQIKIEAAIRDGDALAALEGLRPNNWGQRQSTRVSCAGRTHAVGIDSVAVETKSSRLRLVRIEATKEDVWSSGTGLPGFSFGDRSPDDLTELAIRVALLGEPNPLGQMSFMAEIANPISHIDLVELDEDSFKGVAEVLLVETLVGSGRVERITGLQIGPARSGRPIRLEWVTPRRYSNVEPEKRRIEGKLRC